MVAVVAGHRRQSPALPRHHLHPQAAAPGHRHRRRHGHRPLDGLRVGDAMAVVPPSVEPSTPFAALAARFLEEDRDALPVAGERLEGIVTRLAVEEAASRPDAETTAANLLAGVPRLAPDDTLERGVEVLAMTGHSVPVLAADGTITGWLAESDVLRASSRSRRPPRRPQRRRSGRRRNGVHVSDPPERLRQGASRAGEVDRSGSDTAMPQAVSLASARTPGPAAAGPGVVWACDSDGARRRARRTRSGCSVRRRCWPRRGRRWRWRCRWR